MSCCCFSFKGFHHKVESYHCVETSTCCHMDVLGNPSGLLTSRWTSVHQSVFVISWKRKLFHRQFWSISILAENLRSADHNTAPLGYPAASHSQESKECPKLVPKMSSWTHSHTTPVAALMDAESGQVATRTFYMEWAATLPKDTQMISAVSIGLSVDLMLPKLVSFELNQLCLFRL